MEAGLQTRGTGGSTGRAVATVRKNITPSCATQRKSFHHRWLQQTIATPGLLWYLSSAALCCCSTLSRSRSLALRTKDSASTFLNRSMCGGGVEVGGGGGIEIGTWCNQQPNRLVDICHTARLLTQHYNNNSRERCAELSDENNNCC